MLESKNIHILGYSGHAYVVIDAALSNNYNIISYFDQTQAKRNPYNLKYSGFENKVDIKSIVNSDIVFPAIGSNTIREKLIKIIEENQLKQTQLIDQTATVSKLSEIGTSTLVAPNAVVNSMTVIGKGCVVNSGAIIEHECGINNYSHVAPGAVLAGNVIVGSRTFIGANVVIKNGVTIGDNVTIGAGAVVLKDIPSNETWIGNPARRI